jgi:hypothetical protein
MNKNYSLLLIKLIFFATFILISFISNAQVGVGTTAPDADLDVVSTAAAGNALQVNAEHTTNTSATAIIKNLGLGTGLNLQLLNTANTNPGIEINQLGAGAAMYNRMEGSGYGIYNELLGTSTLGIYQDLSQNGGIAEYANYGVQDGNAFFVNATNDINTPTSGGDVFAFRGDIHTSTPWVPGEGVFGAVFVGIQHGRSHTLILNHTAASGRNAEAFTVNTANNDPAFIAGTLGGGSAIVAINQNNNITGILNVGYFGYQGTDVDNHIGVVGLSEPAPGWGVGVLGQGNFYGVLSNGDSGATGTKTFLIDHPEDPTNKMLKHFSIESNEVLNMYRGTAIFDTNGKAVVSLPDYYDSINSNPSYQLTPIGAAMPNLYIAVEISNGQFVIAGGAPNKKVSWQITAERNDPYMQQNPQKREVVVIKEGERKGKYLNPELYGQPKEEGMFYNANNENIKPSKIDDSSLKKN